MLAVRGPRGNGLAGADHRDLRAPAREPSRLRVRARPAQHPPHRRAAPRRPVRREPTLGNQVWDWAELLAQHCDPGFAEQGQLTVTYLTEAHRACAAQLARWMQRVRLRRGRRSMRSATSSASIAAATPRRQARCSPARTTTPCATAASTTAGSASSCRWSACASCTAPAGACRSASRWSASPRRKASATRPPSSARAR